MSDGESTTPAPRRRPTYGRPAPTSPGTGSGFADGSGVDPTADPGSSADAPGSGLPSQQPSFGFSAGSPAAGGAPDSSAYAPVTGPLPSQPPVSTGPQKRRGLWPLIIGLALLLLVAPAATIGGLVWSFSSLVGDASTGPTVLEGGTGDVEVSANEMLILYVPSEDAGSAQCTAEGSSSGTVTQFPTSGSVTFGDGAQYEQVLGVAALEDTTISVSCTGTDAPAYLGPYSLVKIAAPMLIGPIIGIISGLVGLVLTILGIVRIVRSRRV